MGTKNFLMSKTIWGAMLMAVAFMLKQFLGVEVTTDETGAIVESVGNGDWASIISAVVGFGLTVWGRVTAKKSVTLGPGKAG